MFKLVNDNIHGITSWFFIQPLVESGGEVKGVLPGHLAVCGGSIVCVVKVMP